MDLNSKIKMRGDARIELFDAKSVILSENGDVKDGKLIRTIEKKNLIVDTGLNHIRAAITRITTPMGYIATGTSTTAPAAGQTALIAEIDRTATIAYIDSPTPGIVSLRAVFGASQAIGNLAEFGVFNDAVAGTMLSRLTITPFTKDNTILVRITWTFTFVDT